MRELVTHYLDDFLARGEAVAFAHRVGMRTFRWSYADVARKAHAFANLLAEHRVSTGDRVLLCGANSAYWLIAFFGCLIRGAIGVPLDLQSEPGFAERVQRQVEAKLAVFDPEARQHLSLSLPIVPLEGLGDLFPTRPVSAFSESAKSGDEIAEIVFTSGTTAEPKGTVLTHRNLLANLRPLEREIQPYLKWERLVHPIRFLNLVPLSHVFGQFMGIFVPQLLGGEVFFADSLKPSEIIETVRRERISVIVCVPRMLDTLRHRVEREYEPETLQRLLRSARKWSAPRRWWEFRRAHFMFGLKFWAFVSGGATLSSETEDFWHRLGFALIQGYGMTETASLVSVNHPFKKKAGSIGAVMPGQEIRVSDQGEILVRGRNVSPGYWSDIKDRLKSPSIDEEIARQPASESEGRSLDFERVSSLSSVTLANHEDEDWFHTGDIGEFDSEGNLYFKGRQKEVIVTSAGMNIYPEDLEAVLNQQPEIRSCAVIGIEGAHGPEPVATLILQGLSSASQPTIEAEVAKVIERANESLAEHQKIRRWFVWPDEDFPRTATQKIKKALVAERIAAAPLNRPLEPAPTDQLAVLIARVSGEAVSAVDRKAKLASDLKLDSLGRVELLSAIEERYQVEINEAAFTEATTIGDIENLIRSEPPLKTPVSTSAIENQKSKIANQYPYPHWPHRWPINWFRIAALYLIIFPFARIMGRARVMGSENLSDQPGPLLFVSNHLSMVDHGLILWSLPHRLRKRVSIAMDGELLREWLHPPEGTGWFTRLRYRTQYLLVAFFFNVFAMPQHTGFRRSFAFAGEMMDRGYSVLVFPEGRRSPDGTLQPFRTGIGLLVQQLSAPVVPFRLDGIYELAQQGKHFAAPGAVTIKIGEPVNYEELENSEQITADLERRVKEL